ncbi:hypothetical protein T484DRAFT_1903910 [Baffinella frigidus]|nr:hypothetical protein T484DRAFT_1903910 [Cryptophyta sp. CCMP2293]
MQRSGATWGGYLPPLARMAGPDRARAVRTRRPLMVLVLAMLLVLALCRPASCESKREKGEREGDNVSESSGTEGQGSFESRLIKALITCDRWRSSTGKGPSPSTRWEADTAAPESASDSEAESEDSAGETETGGGETAAGDASNDEEEDLAENAAAAKEEEEPVEEAGTEPEQTEKETEEQDPRGAERRGTGGVVGEDEQPGGGSSATEAPRGGWKRLRTSASDARAAQSSEGGRGGRGSPSRGGPIDPDAGRFYETLHGGEQQ